MPQPVIFFDGVCNLCNGAVRFVLQQDKNVQFRFAPLQSPQGEALLKEHGVLKKFDSFVLLQNETLFFKSTAALKVLACLPWYWRWAQIFWLVPRAARDWVYDVVARNRYKWFGKKNACMLPTPDIKARFLS